MGCPPCGLFQAQCWVRAAEYSREHRCVGGHFGSGSTPGHKLRPAAGRWAVCTEQHQCTSLPKTPKLAAVTVGGRSCTQLNCRCQSTAAATEASLGAFGWLFGRSQHPKNKPDRKINFVKKLYIWGPQLKYCGQSTAAAMEANPGGFGGLFGCS